MSNVIFKIYASINKLTIIPVYVKEILACTFNFGLPANILNFRILLILFSCCKLDFIKKKLTIPLIGNNETKTPAATTFYYRIGLKGVRNL